MTTTYTIDGYVTGALWWPIGAPAGKPCAVTFTRDESQARPFGPKYAGRSLLDMLEAIDLEESGDFSSALRFTADTVVVIRHTTFGRHVQHIRETVRPLTDFPSVAHYVAADVYASDFNSEED